MISRETSRYLETKDENITTQNLWEKVKALLRGKFIAIKKILR